MKKLLLILIMGMSICFQSCNEDEDLQKEIDALDSRITALAVKVGELNLSIQTVHIVMDDSTIIVGVTPTDKGYKIELNDGTELLIHEGDKIAASVPLMGIDAQGYWIVSTDQGEIFNRVKDAAGKDIPAYPSVDSEQGHGNSPKLTIDAEGYWLVSYDGGKTSINILDGEGEKVNAVGDNTDVSIPSFFKEVEYDDANKTLNITLLTEQTLKLKVLDTFSLKIEAEGQQDFFLNDTRVFNVVQIGVVSAEIHAPKGWSAQLTETTLTVKSPASSAITYEDKIFIDIVSKENYRRVVTLNIKLTNQAVASNSTKAWKDFVTANDENLLLDFSYAGYKHGEVGPPKVSTLGYTTYDVTTYGAFPNDEISDRQAFIAAVAAAKSNRSGIVYFPAGRFILHDETDNTDNQSSSIIINTGNIIIKGAGRDQTTIVMKTPNLPTDPAIMYSSPVMINIKHNSDHAALTTVTGDAKKGTFSLEVATTTGISVGDWVCLYLRNNDPLLVAEEIAPYTASANMTDLQTDGVHITDYHQIASKSGNIITFKEPIMRAVDSKWNWEIRRYPNYDNVGVEDLTFEGNCKEDFVHHGSWQDDGAYKPINLMRLTNSWMRRVTFKNVSEASSIVSCANVSVYDIKIEGRRGHAAIRSQGSSRVFIGKVIDNTNGKLVDGGNADGAGQFHACGVSKTSMGAVLWNLDWGTDGTFEAHASQPRATLVDNCTGALIRPRAGGAADQLPNHLADLTLWNLNSKTTSHSANFVWWEDASTYWKFLPPIIVGYHGASVSFDQTQVVIDESNGTKVYPESLYEAQLKLRLGNVPAWLTNLKSI